MRDWIIWQKDELAPKIHLYFFYMFYFGLELPTAIWFALDGLAEFAFGKHFILTLLHEKDFINFFILVHGLWNQRSQSQPTHSVV